MRIDLGDLILDEDTRQLVRGGEQIRLSPKAFDFLALLIRERPNVVTKATLHQQIWSGVFVSDASIAMVASEVRAALGESARAPRWIRTAHGHGYAFTGDVKAGGPSAFPIHRFWLIVGGHALALRDGDNIVGREPGVDLLIDDPSVSRRHACLRVSGADLTVEDLGSKNGTFVGDDYVTVSAVADGETLRFGSALSTCRRSADLTD